jgi:hypothetical protein
VKGLGGRGGWVWLGGGGGEGGRGDGSSSVYSIVEKKRVRLLLCKKIVFSEDYFLL